jgi:hypothetical protein
MASTSCIYIEDMFFRDEMNEKETEKSYPVKIVGLRVGWIINEPEGKKFLQSILYSSNLELYSIESIQMIIEFLFQQFKKIILMVFLPLYIISHLSYD